MLPPTVEQSPRVPLAKKVRVPLFSTLHDVARDPEGKILLGTAITTIAVGTVVYMFLEGWDWIDALYFSVVTLATVGFGDLHPTTDLAKLFTVVYILTGVGIIAGFVSEVARRRRDRADSPVLDEIEHVEDVVVADATARRRSRRPVGNEAEDVSRVTGRGDAGPTVV
jgi:hypothetical protein